MTSKIFFLKLATNGQSDKNFLLTSGFCSQRVILSLLWDYIHVEKYLKMCMKSEFKEICLKLATNGRSDKGFLLTSKVCPLGIFRPCPGAIYMYEIIKNVYKIKIPKRSFWNLQHRGKEKGLFVVIKNSFLMCCLPLPGAMEKYEKKTCRDCFKTWNKWAKW